MDILGEILADHKKNLPAKYDKKGQPIIVGSDELPQPISITEGQKRGSHHFHFQHGPYERRFAMIARNHTRCKVALTCMHLKCSGQVSLIPKKPEVRFYCVKQVSHLQNSFLLEKSHPFPH